MYRYIASLIVVVSAAGVFVLAHPATAQPGADQVLTDMGLSAADRQKVLKGQFVTADVPPVSERDLSIAIAFVVKASPADLSKQIIAGELLSADTQIQAHGNLTSASTVADLAGLKMTDDTAQGFAGASAGSALNLATGEIAAFRALKGAGTQAVQQELQRMLLARFKSYQSSGLRGVTPYDRGGSSADPAADLRLAADAARGLKKYLPGFQKLLADYPHATLAGIDEKFHWIHYSISGKPTYVLAHVLMAPDGDARVVAQRQYYVSSGHNAVQTVTAFLPVAEGTVVVYSNHTFTDQVTGIGGSMKRSIGRGMMEKQLEDIFKRAQKIVQH